MQFGHEFAEMHRKIKKSEVIYLFIEIKITAN